eukprot:9888851-Alexandrium_andersonii.AAC.1
MPPAPRAVCSGMGVRPFDFGLQLRASVARTVTLGDVNRRPVPSCAVARGRSPSGVGPRQCHGRSSCHPRWRPSAGTGLLTMPPRRRYSCGCPWQLRALLGPPLDGAPFR